MCATDSTLAVLPVARFGPRSGQAILRLTRRDVERFWKRVEKTGGCWYWIGVANSGGYGTLKTSVRSAPVAAHRISFAIHKGGVPSGLSVCHRCDNPRCVNPEHLFLGTHEENMRDMRDKERRVARSLAPQGSCGHWFTPNNALHRTDGSRICAICFLAAEQERCVSAYRAALAEYDASVRLPILSMLPAEIVARQQLGPRDFDVLSRAVGAYGREPEATSLIAHTYAISRQRAQQIRDHALAVLDVPAGLMNHPSVRRFGHAAARVNVPPHRRRHRRGFHPDSRPLHQAAC